jgi:hypothetical protein
MGLPLARFGPTTPARATRLADASVDPTNVASLRRNPLLLFELRLLLGCHLYQQVDM